ncbi:MAG: alpha/beta hydrolase [Bdellovibrionales bacterium]
MTIEFLSLADCRLAYQRQVGDKNRPGILFLSGFASDMEGVKASFLSKRAVERNWPFVRFDFRGCGKSSGEFAKATIGAWLEDTLAVFDKLTEGPQIVVGSSMGGWMGLLLAQARPTRVKAFIGVAAAPDFTENLVWAKLTPAEREKVRRTGVYYEKDELPSRQAPITLGLIEEARRHLVLDKPLALPCPVRLLQGMKDTDVPWEYALRIIQHISSDDARVTLVKGDHSLSTQRDLEMLERTIEEFL